MNALQEKREQLTATILAGLLANPSVTILGSGCRLESGEIHSDIVAYAESLADKIINRTNNP
jgi:citrate lyase alpha subunit